MHEDEIDLDEKPELNITPLVDVMLVLLAILMIGMPTITYQEDITLPRGSKSKKLEQDSMLEVRVSLDKKVYVKESVYELKGFADNFVLLSAPLDKKIPVFIRADKDLRYEDVMYILKSVKEAGFLRVSLVTGG
ncbi:biopolymer transporter ExbD [Helicobacter sp. MIT 00-7814]|uniref:ExbD/TolR family protein n=1 Tax=unclassified Helicobacter TaxID=2593540 RepID=UPI000E1F66B7|nr:MULTISPECIES: biopolymer transporter ExbD [unclassified Helicobacter]RDU56193.1 biopolymer transporter ExbD [Helicobacter sp. MIT 99-10781]RDU56290.1 biopolymer transporter ExbD [Helicobacter sp. MIT 00-7814]